MIFKDRNEAAILLLEKLLPFKGKNIIVAGIPRGAMPMAKIISDGLHGVLTCVLVHKLPHPVNEEFAIGCVGESGHYKLSSYVDQSDIEESYVKEQVSHQLEVLKKRKKNYHMKEIDMKDKIVIIVDDGIATGSTTKCAIEEIKYKNPSKVILAVPVSSQEAYTEIASLVDEFYCLYIPTRLSSVGQYYRHFSQVSDDEVINLLANPAAIDRY
jgi:putative phosphoribosyl transferase